MENNNELIKRLKNEGLSLLMIIKELKSRNADPLTTYHLLKINFVDCEDEIRKFMVDEFHLKQNFSFENPFMADFFDDK